MQDGVTPVIVNFQWNSGGKTKDTDFKLPPKQRAGRRRAFDASCAIENYLWFSKNHFVDRDKPFQL